MIISLPSSLSLASIVAPYSALSVRPRTLLFSRWGNRNRDCIASLRACNGQAVRFSLSAGVHRPSVSSLRPALDRRRRLSLLPARVRRVPNVLGIFSPISRRFQDDYCRLLLIIAAIFIYSPAHVILLYLLFRSSLFTVSPISFSLH